MFDRVLNTHQESLSFAQERPFSEENLSVDEEFHFSEENISGAEEIPFSKENLSNWGASLFWGELAQEPPPFSVENLSEKLSLDKELLRSWGIFFSWAILSLLSFSFNYFLITPLNFFYASKHFNKP